MTDQPQRETQSRKPGFCAERTRLGDEFLEAIRELVALHEQQTRAVIEGDPDFSRFELLIHVASLKKDHAKYALINHIEWHSCEGEQ